MSLGDGGRQRFRSLGHGGPVWGQNLAFWHARDDGGGSLLHATDLNLQAQRRVRSQERGVLAAAHLWLARVCDGGCIREFSEELVQINSLPRYLERLSEGLSGQEGPAWVVEDLLSDVQGHVLATGSSNFVGHNRTHLGDIRLVVRECQERLGMIHFQFVEAVRNEQGVRRWQDLHHASQILVPIVEVLRPELVELHGLPVLVIVWLHHQRLHLRILAPGGHKARWQIGRCLDNPLRCIDDASLHCMAVRQLIPTQCTQPLHDRALGRHPPLHFSSPVNAVPPSHDDIPEDSMHKEDAEGFQGQKDQDNHVWPRVEPHAWLHENAEGVEVHLCSSELAHGELCTPLKRPQGVGVLRLLGCEEGRRKDQANATNDTHHGEHKSAVLDQHALVVAIQTTCSCADLVEGYRELNEHCWPKKGEKADEVQHYPIHLIQQHDGGDCLPLPDVLVASACAAHDWRLEDHQKPEWCHKPSCRVSHVGRHAGPSTPHHDATYGHGHAARENNGFDHLPLRSALVAEGLRNCLRVCLHVSGIVRLASLPKLVLEGLHVPVSILR
mmetsp:Transcript_35059/g.80732  ORF Transcript_35059/g.80732 Transcript_35059/m.80732 type:complete len:555 (+) Transcript_35059:84-1748(+)